MQSPLLPFFGAVTVYYVNGHTSESTSDPLSVRWLPVSLLLDHDFYLDEWSTIIQQYDNPYFVQFIEGHVVSTYPPWRAILALPAYVIPVFRGAAHLSHELLIDLEKRAAVLITALSMLILFLALRRLTKPRVAWCGGE